MTNLDIFEPAMCCETGICGVDPDTVLINFTADIEWLRSQGVAVQRFNLAQEPGAFVGDPMVKAEINEHGETCLPLLILEGAVVSRGKYLDRAQLKSLTGIDASTNSTARLDENSDEAGCCSGPDTGCC